MFVCIISIGCDMMEDVRFEAEKAWYTALIIFGMIGLLLYTMIFVDESIYVKLIFVPVILFLLSIWFYTDYTITSNNTLKIRSSFIIGKVDVDDIIVVEEKFTLQSSATLSFNALVIKSKSGLWNKNWIISPKDKDLFILELLRRNPNIEIIRK